MLLEQMGGPGVQGWGGWGRVEGVQTILEAEGALTCWCSSGTGCWLASAPLGSLPGEGTAMETAT